MPNTDSALVRHVTIRRAACGVAVAAVALTAGCTSSGSGSTPTSGPSSSSSSPTSSQSASTRVAHANPFVYKPVTKAQAKKLEIIAVRAPGVQNVGYIPKQKTLQVYLTTKATLSQRVVADRVVQQVLHPAAKPSAKHTTKHSK